MSARSRDGVTRIASILTPSAAAHPRSPRPALAALHPAALNNAGQHNKHFHFWNWMKPEGGGDRMASKLKRQIVANLGSGATPILDCDVWEHSYYIDNPDRRPDYLKAFLDHWSLGLCGRDVHGRGQVIFNVVPSGRKAKPTSPRRQRRRRCRAQAGFRAASSPQGP